MPPAYTSRQKAAITQLSNLARIERTAAAKLLREHGWSTKLAFDSLLSVGSSPSRAKDRAELAQLFHRYTDSDSNEVVGMTGTLKYLTDIGVEVEDVGMLLAMTTLKSQAMGSMNRKDFVVAWADLGCESLPKQKAYIQNALAALPTSQNNFTAVYRHAFQLSKEEDKRYVLLEPAIACWRLLFQSPYSAVPWQTPTSPWLDRWLAFHADRKTQAINRDIWNETLRFARMTLDDPDLSFWSENASWPSVIDEFVAWVREKRQSEA